jgi:lipid A 3-O-deacylase
MLYFRKISMLALAVVSLGQSYNAHALDASMSVGHTGQTTIVYRLSLQSKWDESWLESSIGHVTGYWDTGLTHWVGDRKASNNTLSFAPVFRYEFSGDFIKPFIDAGIGVSAFQRLEVENKQLGTAFNFEDRIGAGLHFGNGQEVSLRVIHYSNAGIKDPNDGIESYSLNYLYPL